MLKMAFYMPKKETKIQLFCLFFLFGLFESVFAGNHEANGAGEAETCGDWASAGDC
ncbi:hypothetical protein V6Z11_D03G049200 [Gossypium hirsutum]